MSDCSKCLNRCDLCGRCDCEQDAARAEADRLRAFLLRLAETGGAIVSSGSAHVMEIADAQARGDWLVVDNLGFILRFRAWRERAESAIRASREGER